jgi:hypothetical protein
MQDPGVRAVVLDLDSPGGEVNGCAELAEPIARYRGKKPLVAYVSGTGASAAYWLASACEEKAQRILATHHAVHADPTPTQSQAHGGWTDSQIPGRVYADQQAGDAHDEAGRVRAKIRGRGRSDQSDPRKSRAAEPPADPNAKPAGLGVPPVRANFLPFYGVRTMGLGRVELPTSRLSAPI